MNGRAVRERLILEGFATKTYRSLTVIVGLFLWAHEARPADLSLSASGNLLGFVVNAEEVPQMGATVQLFDRVGKLRARTVSLADGRFGFAGLAADLYSVRVTLADYLPAVSDRISVKPGLNSVLQIHLATLLSNVELHYSLPGAAMSSDWKWVLRSSPATRPITRFRSEDATVSSTSDRVRVFSETHAALSVSGGDSSFVDTDDVASSGTGFALSTNILGKNQLRLGGSLGQANSMYPGAAVFSAFYSRDDGNTGNSPEVTVNVTQLGLVNGISGPGNAQAEVRIMSMSIYQAMDVTADVRLEYGATGETVDYVQHSAHSSPFLRVTRSFGTAGDLIASFSDGSRPDALLAHQEPSNGTPEVEPADTDGGFAPLPQLSYRNGQIELQRTFSYEAGYRKISGRHTLAVSAFDERVSDGRMDVAGDRSSLNSTDLMSDGFSATSIYNIGQFSRRGLVASADERITSTMDAGLSYGCLGGFVTGSGALDENGVLSGFLQQRSLNTVNTNFNARLPRAGTRISANYGWVDGRAIVPEHIFTTQNNSITPGLNLSFRQPLPSFFGMSGRLELRADVRNLLAQGYLPVNAGDGKTMLVMQAPRAVRGGLNFTF